MNRMNYGVGEWKKNYSVPVKRKKTQQLWVTAGVFSWAKVKWKWKWMFEMHSACERKRERVWVQSVHLGKRGDYSVTPSPVTRGLRWAALSQREKQEEHGGQVLSGSSKAIGPHVSSLQTSTGTLYESIKTLSFCHWQSTHVLMIPLCS